MHDFRRAMRQGVDDAVRDKIADAFRQFHDGNYSIDEYNDILQCVQADGDQALRMIEDVHSKVTMPSMARYADDCVLGDEVFDRRFKNLLSSSPSSPCFSVGDDVFHKKFGIGVVKVVDGNKISVMFEQRVGLKKLIADFLEPLFDSSFISSECGQGRTTADLN